MLPLVRASVLILLLELSVQLASAQTSPLTPTVRDPQAVLILRQALAAMGGTQAVSAIQDAVAIGHRVPLGDETPRPFTWKYKWGEQIYESWEDSDDDGNTRRFASGSKGTILVEKKDRILFPRTDAPHAIGFLPFLMLLRELTNTQYAISAPETVVTASGRNTARIHVELQTDSDSRVMTPQDWFFDARTNLPVRVEYVANVGPKGAWNRASDKIPHPPAAWDYDNFHLIGAVVVPLKLSQSINGEPFGVIALDSVVFNNGLSSSDFDVP